MKPRLLRLWVPAVAGSVALACLALFFPPDGGDRTEWLQFPGRFHVVAVHLPIGLLIVAPLMEALGTRPRWSYLRPAARFLLGVTCAVLPVSIVLGWMLAYAGGYEGNLVNRHMWGGVALNAVCWAAFIVRPDSVAGGTPGSRRGYASLLSAAVILLLWTSHQGGSLTHGRGFLTARMPAPLKAAFGIEERTLMAAHAFPDAFFATHLQPLFEVNCAYCHGPDRSRGGLRLDSFPLMMEGGDYGPPIVPFEPDRSEMVRRITLPRDHEDFMPTEGKRPLSESETSMIIQWIALGASPRETAAELAAKGMDIPVDETPVVVVRAPDYRPFVPVIRELENTLGVRLIPVSRVETDGLVLRTVSDPESFDDAALERLAPVADLIVDAELARTEVSDAGLSAISRFSNLRKLDLSHTAVTSAALEALIPLTRLEWLNLVGTGVGDGAAGILTRLDALERVYLFGSNVTPEVRSRFEVSVSDAGIRDPESPETPIGLEDRLY